MTKDSVNYKIWTDVERAALYEPILQVAVTYVRQGTLSREQALVVAVLALAQVKQQQHEALVKIAEHSNV